MRTKMPTQASDWLRHILILRWTEFTEIWLKARSQHPLQSLCFKDDRKTKMTALAYDRLRHFRLLIWISWMEFNDTSIEANSQHLDQVVVFLADRKTKMAAPASDWLTDFQLLLWKHWTEYKETWLSLEARFQRPLATYFVFPGQSQNQDGHPGRWLAETVSTAERNSTKPVRKQVLTILINVCVFRAGLKTKMAAPASDWPRHF